MSATDFERNETLDDLSSAQLEEQAFGPAPKERPTLRGLVARPASAPATTYRVRPARRRWPLALAALAGTFAIGFGVAVAVEGPPVFEEPIIVEIEEPLLEDEMFEMDAFIDDMEEGVLADEVVDAEVLDDGGFAVID